ncbi:MAG: 4-hydroxythreonine-4-phosphate dehydrogenase PdxA [Verrucomicrobiales bacterium]
MGDPAGVGPEVCLHLLADSKIREQCRPIVFGDLAVLAAAAEATGLPAPNPVDVRDVKAIALADFTPGDINAATGKAGYTYVDSAINAANAGDVDGVATAPLNKEALHLAGIKFPGHTEIFAEKTGTSRFAMLQYSEVISCSFVTVHCGYSEVPKFMTTERIVEVIELTHAAFLKIRGKEPKIVVLGLNPHAGEHGLFGNREEETVITPAMDRCRGQGITKLEGPIPPDTAFIPAKLAQTDAFICMYHDQGHIPVKALAFDKAVNTTLGLPFPRTSVDHGTALDIAWQGLANPSSLFEAVKLNVKLVGKSNF